MKITINAFGTRGDVQPYIALGLGLKNAGHQVTVNTHRIFEDFVRQYGLDYFPNEIDSRQVLLSESVAELGANPFKISGWITRHFKATLAHLFETTLDAAQDSDLLVNSVLSLAGWHAAQKLQIPVIGTYLQPYTPTEDFPAVTSPVLPSWLPFRGAYNYLSAKFTNQSVFSLLRQIMNDCRAEIYDLPPLGMSYYWQVDSPNADVPMVYGFSQHIIPRPANWNRFKRVTGYWFLDQSKGYQPPPDLVNFLESGPPPVYIGFGSMVDHEQEKITSLILEALEIAACRAVLLSGWSELGQANLPDTVYAIDSVPHDWLFPQMSAVVHHGGAGTTHTGLHAGVPSIIVPFFGDQPFWGRRVYDLGVGPRPIPRKKLTARHLAQSILHATTSDRICKNAARLGKKIRKEDGISQAVKAIQNPTLRYIP